jgi:hypothetical protein
MNDAQKLLKAMNLLEQVMGNYQVAASVADVEGYETDYAQDVILVDFLKGEVTESNND